MPHDYQSTRNPNSAIKIDLQSRYDILHHKRRTGYTDESQHILCKSGTSRTINDLVLGNEYVNNTAEISITCVYKQFNTISEIVSTTSPCQHRCVLAYPSQYPIQLLIVYSTVDVTLDFTNRVNNKVPCPSELLTSNEKYERL